MSAMKKQSYDDALRKVNEKRKKNGQEPLAFLPRGKPQDSKECPMARAGVTPSGDFVNDFDKEAKGFAEIDPWVLVDNGNPAEGDDHDGSDL